MATGYSPLRRWLRQERTREHLDATEPDARWVRAWKDEDVFWATRLIGQVLDEIGYRTGAITIDKVIWTG